MKKIYFLLSIQIIVSCATPPSQYMTQDPLKNLVEVENGLKNNDETAKFLVRKIRYEAALFLIEKAKSDITSKNSQSAILNLVKAKNLMPANENVRNLYTQSIEAYIEATKKFDSCDFLNERISFISEVAPDSLSKFEDKIKICSFKNNSRNKIADNTFDLESLRKRFKPSTQKIEFENSFSIDLTNWMNNLIEFHNNIPWRDYILLSALYFSKNTTFEIAKEGLGIKDNFTQHQNVNGTVEVNAKVDFREYPDIAHLTKGLFEFKGGSQSVHYFPYGNCQPGWLTVNAGSLGEFVTTELVAKIWHPPFFPPLILKVSSKTMTNYFVVVPDFGDPPGHCKIFSSLSFHPFRIIARKGTGTVSINMKREYGAQRAFTFTASPGEILTDPDYIKATITIKGSTQELIEFKNSGEVRIDWEKTLDGYDKIYKKIGLLSEIAKGRLITKYKNLTHYGKDIQQLQDIQSKDLLPYFEDSDGEVYPVFTNHGSVQPRWSDEFVMMLLQESLQGEPNIEYGKEETLR